MEVEFTQEEFDFIVEFSNLMFDLEIDLEGNWWDVGMFGRLDPSLN
jgi:hypothetical protein